ncbi:uncharacterized protein si:dkey-109l4.3 [Acipenser ruthenus]|uniref:uncharacterized protein si:dkey-109l4.3 n=1 Tax=Acipenser ruthenus TaxID=7906 RepID=UPI002740DF08|nr:uncharacterized protein si:dkey-109l4.3 [Acipenser ruthenus]
MEVENGFLSSGNGTHLSVWDRSSNVQLSDMPSKRKRTCTTNDSTGCPCEANGNEKRATAQETVSLRRSSFVSIYANRGVYQSECWKPNGSTLYLPVTSNLLVNMEKYDQISFEEGSFFIGDKSGGCLQREHGQVIHCWRYDGQDKKLFIALSFLFIHIHMFQEVLSILGGI